ncbi:hypothetical protein MIR68_001401 [Amoeboaphelidium protococcarum]|nr:hypothetical protein MIR68_001401 [Amoeboaphelidium protococcarum]
MLNFHQIGCISGALAVGLGAFGAHGLRTSLMKQTKDVALVDRKLSGWSTAASYQLLHSVMIVIASQYQQGGSQRPLSAALFTCGNLLFSGSIYLLTLNPGWKFLGPVTPVGGLCYIAGWLALLAKR